MNSQNQSAFYEIRMERGKDDDIFIQNLFVILYKISYILHIELRIQSDAEFIMFIIVARELFADYVKVLFK